MVEGCKVLVVDDEARLRELVRTYLIQDGFEVEELDDGAKVLERIQQGGIDLLILDLMLPNLDGLTLCREIRRFSTLPIILLTARGEEMDRVLGFDLGADDYITKPFSPRELVARVRALWRRSAGYSTEERLNLGRIEVDPVAYHVTVDGVPVNLTPREFALFLFLLKNLRRVFSRESLLAKVWGFDFFGDTRTVDTHVKKIREKLRSAGYDADLIQTVWGVGYKIEMPS